MRITLRSPGCPHGILAAGLAALSGLALILSSGTAYAQVTTIGPFTGTISETWESFPNYLDTLNTTLIEPATIFGGAATITSTFTDIGIYEPSAGADWGLIDNGVAQVADGTKGAGLNSFGDSATIAFANPVTAFGGFFASAAQGGNGNFTITLFDASNNIIDSPFGFNDTDTDGSLSWHGFASTIPIKFVTYAGDFTVVDGLQANVLSAAAPEPGSIALAACGALPLAGLVLSRRRR